MTVDAYVMYNLYKMGCLEGEDMSIFYTYNKQYRFELKREPVELWQTDTSYKFKCKIDIYDNLTNNHLVAINCNESDIINILDCYTQMNEYGMKDIMCPPLAPFSATGRYYVLGFELYRIDNVHNLLYDISARWINIKEHDPMTNQFVDRLSIETNVDELEDLMNLLFFTFLIDQEEKFGIVPMDSIGPSEFL